MPIYEYRCNACGFQSEYLQKVSDPTLTDCPECGQDSFAKLVTAAGFQLKGSGWYATDFRNAGGKSKPAGGDAGSGASTDSGSAPADAGKSDAGGTTSQAGSCGAGACPACT